MDGRLSILNVSPTKVSGPDLLHRLVAGRSEDIAIDYQDLNKKNLRLTYTEFHDRSDRLARRIVNCSTPATSQSQRSVVPLLLPQCPSLYVAQLAILKAGSAFCPLPIDAPEDRLRFILQDVSARVVLTTGDLLHKLPEVDGVTVIDVDSFEDAASADIQLRPVATTDLAYVMYTSGSTGLPKGVLLSHAAVTQALLAHDRHIPTYSRFLQVAAPTFDVSVFEIFFTFYRGQTLVCCDRTQLLADLPGIINSLDVDAAELTPSVASNLLGPRDGVPGLKVLLTIGEMLKKDVVERFGGTSSEDALLHGMYGPTEAAIHCTLQPHFTADMAVNNIGIPLDTVSAFILPPVSDDTPVQDSLNVLPYGDEGELAVGGYQLADGYLNRDEQTRAAFVQHPEHGQLYRTGDKARFVEGDKIECYGRISAGQVKLRGQRMELGEVEYAVSKTPGCTGAVAEVINDTLVVFCKHGTATVSEADVRQVCKKWLPAYMIPSEIILKADLPYLASGKIDRRSLQSEYQSLCKAETPTELPTGDDLTSQITNVVQQIIGPHSVRGKDLKIGNIDSLSSIRIASALGKLGHGQLMATQIMEAQTIEDLTNLLQDHAGSDVTAAKEMSDMLIKQRIESAFMDPLLSSRRAEIDQLLPCSAVQSAMLTESTIEPQRYCNWLELEVDGRHGANDVRTALEKLIRHHSMLRAGFINVLGHSGGFTLVIWKANEVSIVDELNRNFVITDEHQLLRPCKIQLLNRKSSTRLLFQLHHALYDQWSVDVLAHDLESLLAGQAIEPPSYADVLTYYSHNVESAISIESSDFWRETISGVDSVSFPNMNALKAESEQHRTAWTQLNIDMSSLQRVTSERHWSLQSFLQASYAAILTFYHGSSSACYGTVFSGRHIPVAGIDRIFGPCLTTLPVRIDRSNSRSWADIVQKVHDLNRRILKFSDTPLSQIKQLSGLAAGDALFDTMFLWQESVVAASSSGVVHEVDSADHHEFKLALECRPVSGFIQGRVTYDQALMPQSQAETLLKSIESLVNVMITNLESDLVDLDQHHSQELLSISNPEPVQESDDQDLVRVLERSATEHPESLAVLFATSFDNSGLQTQSITYQALHQQANQLARRIQTFGVQADDLVCICMEKSIDFYVAVLAVLKTGAGYLPLVPELQTDRVAAILNQANVKAILTDEFGIKHFGNVAVDVLQPRDWNLKQYSDETLDVGARDSHVAYTIFTSGSTGVPKGVMVTRGNLLGNIITLQRLYHARKGDRLLQACLQSFDVAVFEIFFTFYTGMTLCTATKELLFDDLEASIRSLKVTHLSMTPSVASLVHPDNVPSVRFLVTAGEAMTAAVHSAWAGRGLHQGYGPSETTNICTVNLDISEQHQLGSIGPPFRNTSAFVLDAGGERKILPQGAFGEFAFGGEQVFRGYLGLDELNREKIWDHPQFGRLYRSGDLGRILADGTLLIHGRSDFQVKIRGNRVELGEISASILRQDFVDDCVTIVNTTEGSEPSLLSFWTTSGGTSPPQVRTLADDLLNENAKIFQALCDYLPSYMLPTFIIPVTVLPRTEQGKMDQRSLRSLANELSADTKQQLTRPQVKENIPYHENEQAITMALSETLAISDSGIDRLATFESLGLTSISAVSFSRVLRSKLNIHVPVSRVLRNASVARLARALDASDTARSKPNASSFDFFDSDFTAEVESGLAASGLHLEAVLPCTPLQEAMLAAGTATESTYSNSTTFTINGEVERLKTCFEQMFKRHPMLRTIFVESGRADRPFAQVVLKQVDLPWFGSHSISNAEPEGVTPERPIYLKLDRTEQNTDLTIHMHHATYDGTSLSILLSEIESLYRGDTLPAPPDPYEYLRACMVQSGTEAQQFWSRQFKDFLPGPFPSLKDMQQPPQELQQHSELTSATRDVERFCKDHSVDFSSVAQAAWVKCLMVLQDSKDICFGNVVSGRLAKISDIDRLALPCFNTLPVRARIDQAKRNLDLVRQLARARSTSSKYQLTPLRSIQRYSRKPSARLFDSLLLLQPPAQERDSSLWEYKSETGDMGFPLVLEMITNTNCLDLKLYHLSDRVDSSTAASITSMFDESLQQILNGPSDGIHGSLLQNYKHLAGHLRSTARSDEALLPVSPEDGEATWSEAEAKVREVLSALARVEQSKVVKTTTIYELGLDSLNAAQIAAQLRRAGYKIDMADVLEHRTPAGIAKSIASPITEFDETPQPTDLKHLEDQYRDQVCRSLRIRPEEVEAVRPCSAAQQGMLAQSFATNGKLYVNHVHFALPRRTSTEKLSKSLRLISQRHPLLRALFIRPESDSASFIMTVMKELHTGLEDEPATEETCSQHAENISAVDNRPLWRASLKKGGRQDELVLSLHHALYDATSLQTLQIELGIALQSDTLGSSYSLDDILSTNLQLTTSQSRAAETFWKDAVSNASSTAFPSLTSRQVKGNAIKHASMKLTESFSDIEALCKGRGCTIQAAGQAAWAVLLSDYLGEPHVTFGTVISTRSRHEQQSQIFPSINTLPVAARSSHISSELLRNMVEYNSQLQRHRMTALSDIQRLAGRPGQTLFDTVFVFQGVRSTDREVSLPIVQQSSAVDYKISIEIECPDEKTVQLSVSYAESTLDSAAASLLLKQYEAVLLNTLRGSDEAAYDKTLLAITPPLASVLPSPVRLLHEFVTLGAQRFPDRPAFEFITDLERSNGSRKSWTYAQLDASSNNLANTLRQNGAKSGGVIALCMEKCPEASFAFVAILKMGCAFLAMDPDLPKARKEFILEDSSAQMLITNNTTNLGELETTTKILCISLADIELSSGDDYTPVEVDPQSTCYCLYTSGTTGTPKGCEITHENAVQAMMSFQRLFNGHWQESSRWLQFASYWFDVSVLEHFWSWSVGITMVAAPRDLVLSDLVVFINEAHITHIDLTPSLARLLEPEDVPSLCNGVFITGGEALKQEIIQKWGGQQVICNGYGPTEATIGVTMNPFIGIDAKPANIGPPFANVGSFVLSTETDRPIFRGAIGELCVSGKLVGKGYLNRPDLTEKSFPTLSHLGERVYRTGDLVRQLADNSFLFVGRKDSQAKLRGQRLEIDEIDEVIKSASASIVDVASLVVKSDDGNKQTLVSFITMSQHSDRELQLVTDDPSKTTLREAVDGCRSHLPGYMVPTSILPVTRIPLTVNNKVDAKLLVSFYNSLSAQELQGLDGAEQECLTDEGRKVAEVLAQMLSMDVADMDARSNLFMLGLSSVSVIQFVQRLRNAGYKNADIGLVMRTPDLGRLTKQLTSGSKSDADQTASEIQQAKLSIGAYDRRHRRSVASQLDVAVSEVEAVVPCTPLQTGLIVESLRREHHPYFNTFHLRAKTLDLEQFKKALRQLVSHIQVLRAKFVDTDDGYAQTILKDIPLPYRKTQCEVPQLEQHLRQAKDQWVSANADVLSHPFAVMVTKVSDSSTLISLHLHHAIYDGISLDLLLQALTQLYSEQTPDFGPQFTEVLPYGPLQKVRSSEQYWRDVLQDLTYQPLNDVEESSEEAHAITATFTISSATVEDARKSAKVSHQAVVQAAFRVALRETFPRCSSMGLVTSGRSLAVDDAEKVIGPMFNTLPVDINIGNEATWSQLILQSHDFNVSTLPHQYTPLRDIKKWCSIAADDDLFDVLFVFQVVDGKDNAAASLGEPVFEEPSADYSLAFEAKLADQGTIECTVVAKQAYVDETNLRALEEHFVKAINTLSTTPEAQISVSFDRATIVPSSTSRKRQAHPDMNGVHNFSWSPQAELIKRELATFTSQSEDVVDEHATLFGLGLDSIDAVRLASRLKKNGMILSVSDILKAQTIPRMMSLCKSSANGSANTPLDALRSLQKLLERHIDLPRGVEEAEVDEVLPATPGQEALLALMQESGFTDYLNHDLLEIASDVDIDRLEQAWKIVNTKHPVLRTSFVQVSDPAIDCVFAQVVHKPGALALEHMDLEHQAEIDVLIRRIREDVSNRFETTPPFRVTLVRVNEQRFLLLSLAHALYDGHSLTLLHHDVEKAYHGQDVGRPSPSAAINSALRANSGDSRKFWRDTLHGAESCLLAPRPEATEGKVHRAEIQSKITTTTARAFCRKHAVSLQTLGQTCWALTLAHYKRQLEVLFGTVLACRDTEEAEAVMFPTMNTIVLRAALHGTRSDMLSYVQDFATEMLPHKQTPLRSIQAAYADTGKRRAADGLFNTLFIYQQRPHDVQDSSNPLYRSVMSSSSIDYLVAAEVEVADESVVLRVAVKDEAFSKQEAEELLETLSVVLNQVVSSPDLPAVSFVDGNASVCGLPQFALNSKTSPDPVFTESHAPSTAGLDVSSTAYKSVVEALAQVSGLAAEEISPTSTLEGIGIDSIAAIKVTAILRKKRIRATVNNLVKAKTISAIELTPTTNGAPQADEQSHAQEWSRLVSAIDLRKTGIQQTDIIAGMPVTAGQTYMLGVWRMSRGRLFYPSFHYRLDADLEPGRIEQAWRRLIEEHDALRTSFVATDSPDFPLVQLVLKSVTNQVTFSEVWTSLAQSQPMVGLRAQRAKKGWELELRIHHALYDAVSLELMLQDLATLLSGQKIKSTRMSMSRWLERTATAKAKVTQREFWTSYLSGIAPTALAQKKSYGGARVEVFKPAAAKNMRAVEQACRKQHVGIQSLLFAIWAKVYYKLAEQRQGSGSASQDAVVGIYLSNRGHFEDMLELRAPTVNLVPLVIRRPAERDLWETARDIQRDLKSIGDIDNSAAALWEIAQWTGVSVDTFVNFLKLPEGMEDGNADSDIVVESLDRRRQDARAEVVPFAVNHDFTLPKELEGVPNWQDAYQNSLDIEMRITDDDLDVGVFVLEELASLKEVQASIESIVDEIRECAK